MPFKLGDVISATLCNKKKGDDNGLQVNMTERGAFYVAKAPCKLPYIEKGDKILELNGNYADGYTSEEEMKMSIEEARHVRIKVKRMCRNQRMELHKLNRMHEYNGCDVQVIEEDKRSKSKNRWWVRVIDHPEKGMVSIHTNNLKPSTTTRRNKILREGSSFSSSFRNMLSSKNRNRAAIKERQHRSARSVLYVQ